MHEIDQELIAEGKMAVTIPRTVDQRRREYLNSRWDVDRQREACKVLLATIAQTHADAGHDVHQEGASVRCENCGLRFGTFLDQSDIFGYAPALVCEGQGRPQTITDIDALKEIARGTHRTFGLPVIQEPNRVREYRRMAQIIRESMAELKAMGEFDSPSADALAAAALETGERLAMDLELVASEAR